MRHRVKSMAAGAAARLALETGVAEKKAMDEAQQRVVMAVMRKSEIIYDDELSLRRTGNGKGLIYDPHAEDYHGKEDPGKPIGFVIAKNGVVAGWINGKFDDFEQRPDNPYVDTDFAEINSSNYKEYAEMLANRVKQNEMLSHEDLAHKMDDVMYTLDTYEYRNQFDQSFESEEDMRAAGVKQVLEMLDKDEKGTLKAFLDRCGDEESIESLVHAGATSQLRALRAVKLSYNIASKANDLCEYKGSVGQYLESEDVPSIVESGDYDY